MDEEDYERLAAFNWSARVMRGGQVYAGRYQLMHEREDDKKRLLLMHREVLGLGGGREVEVDHRNGDGLDNRRSNLRPCDHRQNIGNSRKPTGRSSRFKGVAYFRPKRGDSWRASIRNRGIKRHLGSFGTEEEAARAYDKAAVEVFGEFARLNFPAQPLSKAV